MAGSELSANMNLRSYTLFISSSDKVSGSNNNANFNVNWDDFLPREFSTYKMSFSYQSGGGNYKDSVLTSAVVNNINGNTLYIDSGTNAGATIPIIGAPGQLLQIANGTPSTAYITSQISGTAGGNGLYSLSQSITPTVSFTGYMVGANMYTTSSANPINGAATPLYVWGNWGQTTQTNTSSTTSPYALSNNVTSPYVTGTTYTTTQSNTAGTGTNMVNVTSIANFGTNVIGAGTIFYGGTNGLIGTSVTVQQPNLAVTSFTGAIPVSSNVLTVSSAPTSAIVSGEFLAGSSNIPNGCYIQPFNNSLAAFTGAVPASSSILTVTALTSGAIVSGQYLTGSANITTGTTIAPFNTASSVLTGTVPINSQQLTVNTISSGTVAQGQYVTGTNIPANTIILPLNDPAATMTASTTGTLLTVTNVASGFIAVGDYLAGIGIAAGTQIIGSISGAGGDGVYTISISQTVASTTLYAVYTNTATTPYSNSPNNIYNLSNQVTTAINAGALQLCPLNPGTYPIQTGSGGVGTYNLSLAIGTTAITSTTLNTVLYNPSTNPLTTGSGGIGTYNLSSSLTTAITAQVLYGVNLNTTTYPYTTGQGGVGTYSINTAQTTAYVGVPLYIPETITVAPSASSGSVVYSGVKLVMNTLGKSYSFDTTTKSPSSVIGYAQRDMQTTTSSSNSFSAFYLQFPPKTMNRPNQNLINIQIYNLNNSLLMTDTTSTGIALGDMTPYTLILEFTPMQDSLIKTQRY